MRRTHPERRQARLRTRIFITVLLSLLSCVSSAAAADHAASRWYWNKQAAQYALLVQGLEFSDDTMDVDDATCFGTGTSIWGSKGKMFSTFYCAISGTYEISGESDSYNITFYVN